jgi:predicted outer membrane repeat protein
VTNLSDHDPGSLRDAITKTPSGGTVDFQPGLTGTIVLTSGELAISKDLTIEGPGADGITVSGNHACRVFDVANFTVAISGLTIADGMVMSVEGGGGIKNKNGGTLTITSCTFSGNDASSAGNGDRGGIENDGTLTITASTFSGNFGDQGGGIANFFGGTLSVTGSTFSGNSASYNGNLGSNGGGISNIGTLNVTGSTFSGNSAKVYGGGIENAYGTLTVIGSSFSGNSASIGGGIENFYGTPTVTDSTFSGNSAKFSGGGIHNENDTQMTVADCTFSGNSATAYEGGGIYNLGTLTVTDCTFSGNSAGKGGGIESEGGPLTVADSTFSGNSAGTGGGISIDYPHFVKIRNTLLAGNSSQSGGPDVDGPLTSLGHNLIGNGSGGSGYATTDLVGTASNPIVPLLGPLQDNGGPTETMALLPGSPAIRAGALTDSEWDQRGPGFARTVNGRTDIGAYEVQEGDSAQPPAITLMRHTEVVQAAEAAAASCVAQSPRVPLSQVASAVDRLFASSTSEAAGFSAWGSRDAVPGLWPFDVFLPEKECA